MTNNEVVDMLQGIAILLQTIAILGLMYGGRQ